MFEGGVLKRLSDQDILNFLGQGKEQQELWKKRLAALRKKKEREPEWKMTDPQTDCEINISELNEWCEAEAELVEENMEKLTDEYNRRQGLNQTIKMF